MQPASCVNTRNLRTTGGDVARIGTGNDCDLTPAIYNSARSDLLTGNQEVMQELKRVVMIGGCGHVGLPLGIVFANADWMSFFSIAIRPN
jgi:hypothetical protein